LKTGAFIISLDFELAWGVTEDRVEGYRQNLLGARKAVPAILKLFGEYAIHATWAVVGMLSCESRDELLGMLPAARPNYKRPGISAYDRLGKLGANEQEDPLHFASSLITQIAQTPGQEIGTHTFSHYYCLEPGQDISTFQADLQAAKAVAARRGLELSSIVFPRNQVRSDYLAVCRQDGIVAYRGNPTGGIYDSSGGPVGRLSRRAVRLMDTYIPLTGHNAWKPEEADGAAPCNVPASRFLRPSTGKAAPLAALREARILAGLEHAAVHGLCYHLWWHPHNFGRHQEENVGFLKRVLDRFSYLRDEYGMQSLGMAECARKATTGRPQ